MANKPSTGKYKFTTFADITVTTQFNNIGLPIKNVLYHFNNGDVIDVQKMFFNDKSNEWEAQLSAITEQNRTVPFSVLTKVADSTPITTNISRKEQTLSGSKDGMVYGNQPNGNAKSLFTPKNIIIGLLAIGVIVGGLKLAKVF
jgi:heat shock protein HspQ